MITSCEQQHAAWPQHDCIYGVTMSRCGLAAQQAAKAAAWPQRAAKAAAWQQREHSKQQNQRLGRSMRNTCMASAQARELNACSKGAQSTVARRCSVIIKWQSHGSCAAFHISSAWTLVRCAVVGSHFIVALLHHGC